MNPTVAESVVKEALEKDQASAQAEYLAQFRKDVETLISLETLEDVTVNGRRELPCLHKVGYFGFVDPSGGSHDSFTLAISHRENKVAVLDLLREREPRFDPDSVVREYAGLLKAYRINRVMGDRYAGQWCAQAFQKYGISYVPCPKSKSELYLNFLPLLNSGNVQLLDHPRLANQLVNLERRTTKSGRETVDHGPGGFDDLANSAAGALVLAAQTYERKLTWGRDGDLERAKKYDFRPRPFVNHGVVLGRSR
jgi:hypothetical protein